MLCICTFTVDNIQVKFNEIAFQKKEVFLLNTFQVHVCNMWHSFFLLPGNDLRCQVFRLMWLLGFCIDQIWLFIVYI